MQVVADVVRELASVVEFIAAQPRLPTGLDQGVARAEATMVRNLVDRVAGLDALSATDATTLTQLIDAAASLSDQSTSALRDAVLGRVTSTPPCIAKGNQVVADPLSYLTSGDWALLEDSNAVLSQKIYVVGERFQSLGLHNPHEQTYRSLAALICSCHWPQTPPNGQQRHHTVLSLKRHFAASPRFGARVTLVKFPATPRGLPEDVVAKAYPTEADQPMWKQPRRYLEEVRWMVMRKNNKQLSEAKPQTCVMAAQPEAPGPMAVMEKMSQVMQLFAAQLCAPPAAAAAFSWSPAYRHATRAQPIANHGSAEH